MFRFHNYFIIYNQSMRPRKTTLSFLRKKFIKKKLFKLNFQSIIFHVERHPLFTWFEQCVTFNFFPTEQHELAYNLFNVITVYLLPLVIITTSYSLILYKVSKTARRDEGTIKSSIYIYYVDTVYFLTCIFFYCILNKNKDTLKH